jgi:hypothetical protein
MELKFIFKYLFDFIIFIKLKIWNKAIIQL